MSNVAIYGGSFDPVHLGHVMVVSHLLLNDPDVDGILVVPCFQQSGKKLAGFHHRMMMCNHAFGWLPRVDVSPIEEDLGGESITSRLILELKKRHPQTNYRFVMGADLMDHAPKWEGWDVIEELAPPLVIGRAGIAPLAPGDPTPISPAISSTIVRDALHKQDYHAAGRYLPRAVREYIEKHGLYL